MLDCTRASRPSVSTAGNQDQLAGIILIDHANIPFDRTSLRQFLTAWLCQPFFSALPGTNSIGLRSYGGWFKGALVAPDRFKASEFYQDNCPSIIKENDRYWRVRFEFADSVVAANLLRPEDNAAITHTVAVREAAQQVILRADGGECAEAGCELPVVKRWIKKHKACTRPGCPRMFRDHFERTQQKQVDIHLATDLLTLAIGRDDLPLAVASDDIDLLPAILAAGIYRQNKPPISLIRVATRASYLDTVLHKIGVTLVTAAPEENHP